MLAVEEPPLLTVAEVEWLLNISEKTRQRLEATGELVPFMIRGAKRYQRERA